jgi:hypothetical protein
MRTDDTPIHNPGVGVCFYRHDPEKRTALSMAKRGRGEHTTFKSPQWNKKWTSMDTGTSYTGQTTYEGDGIQVVASGAGVSGSTDIYFSWRAADGEVSEIIQVMGNSGEEIWLALFYSSSSLTYATSHNGQSSTGLGFANVALP